MICNSAGKISETKSHPHKYCTLSCLGQAKTLEGQRIDALDDEIDMVDEEVLRKSHHTRQLEHMLLRLKNNQV